MTPCIFCEIVAGRAPASIIHQDETLMAFMGIQPSGPGECLIIPRRHVDHFTDLDDGEAQRIIVLAQRIGRRMLEVFKPRRVGMLVHGFGVPHAHFILVPQNRTDDLTSRRFARIQDGQIVFDLQNIPFAERATLDEHARLLAGAER